MNNLERKPIFELAIGFVLIFALIFVFLGITSVRGPAAAVSAAATGSCLFRPEGVITS